MNCNLKTTRVHNLRWYKTERIIRKYEGGYLWLYISNFNHPQVVTTPSGVEVSAITRIRTRRLIFAHLFPSDTLLCDSEDVIRYYTSAAQAPKLQRLPAPDNVLSRKNGIPISDLQSTSDRK